MAEARRGLPLLPGEWCLEFAEICKLSRNLSFQRPLLLLVVRCWALELVDRAIHLPTAHSFARGVGYSTVAPGRRAGRPKWKESSRPSGTNEWQPPWPAPPSRGRAWRSHRSSPVHCSQGHTYTGWALRIMPRNKTVRHSRFGKLSAHIFTSISCGAFFQKLTQAA